MEFAATIDAASNAYQATVKTMCGIFGALSGNGTVQFDPRLATNRLAHRGPDDIGLWEGDGTSLAMRRLSIIDVEGGQQPIWNEDHTLGIVYNGELYNFLDLRPELERRGHSFRTRSDTEVVLHAYEEWGPDCVTRFNGMFAFAIWNTRERRLFLARDPLGEKPLYYYCDRQHFVFASEIKAIIANPAIPRRIDLHGLSNFLAFGHSQGPTTMYYGIYKLPAGHHLTVSVDSPSEKVHITRYWEVGQDTSALSTTPNDLESTLLTMLDDSVRRRMIADVPVGAFLSGGVDSSAVVALMKRHATGPVATFSLGFTAGKAYNELSAARQVATWLGTAHHELDVGHIDLVQVLRTLVYHYDEPFGDAAGFPVYLLSQFARQHVKVVLAGDGGDELFGGYRRYAFDAFAPVYQRLPDIIGRHFIPALVDRLPRLRRVKRAVQCWQIPDAAQRYPAWLLLFTPEMQHDLLHLDVTGLLNGYEPAYAYAAFYHSLNGKSAADHLNRLMYVDLKTLLVDGYLEKVDKATMACGLEARLPILDIRLVELAFRIPSSAKIQGLSTKRIFKHAVRDLVPPAVLRRPKHGFAVPTDPWFRGDLKAFVFDVLTDPHTRARGIINTAMVEQLWREHQSGRNVWDTHLWLLLNLELWQRIYLDGEPI